MTATIVRFPGRSPRKPSAAQIIINRIMPALFSLDDMGDRSTAALEALADEAEAAVRLVKSGGAS